MRTREKKVSLGNLLNSSPDKFSSEQSSTDRYIPSRQSSKLFLAYSDTNLEDNYAINYNTFRLNNAYRDLIFGYNPSCLNQGFHFQNQNLFRYTDYRSEKDDSISLLSQNSWSRDISNAPSNIIYAPDLQDDYYLNLLDWSKQNILAVGLSSSIYLWSEHNSKVKKLGDLGMFIDPVTSVSWDPQGTFLGVGTDSGDLQIWDPIKLKKIRVMTGHSSRVGTLSWNSSLVISGSKDQNIYLRDVRLVSNSTTKFVGHKKEVCGLKWSFDGKQFCSGGADNQLLIWNLHSQSPIIRFTNHTSAVKALAWSPYQHGLLASGGGIADRTIRFWNTQLSKPIGCLDTESQVCNLIFSKNGDELVSSHGYSQNQIIVWKFPSMKKIETLKGHDSRVIYLAMSPDGQTIATGAGDQTIRFWRLFPELKKGPSKLLPSSFDLH